MADFGMAAADYAQFRQGFPASFFACLSARGIGGPGRSVLDLGTGTGLLARAFAAEGASVTGLDCAEATLAEARGASQAAGLEIAYRLARAEDTGLAPAGFDVVAAATCWHWFDRAAAAREAFRLLRPGGHLLIAHLDWDCRPGNVVDVTAGVIDRFSPRRPGGRYTFEFPKWLGDLVAASFADYEAFAYSEALSYSRAAWCGRVRASARVGPAMDQEILACFDAELAAELHRRFPEDPLAVDHRIFALILEKP